MFGLNRLFSVYFVVAVLLLFNVILFNNYLGKSGAVSGSSNVTFAAENNFEEQAKTPTSKKASTDSEDIYNSLPKKTETETLPASQNSENNPVYSLYFYKTESKQLLTAKMQNELLNTLITLDKPKPLGQYYYVTNVDSEGDSLLVSIASRQLEEITDTTNTDPEDYFFTIRINTGQTNKIDLFSNTVKVSTASEPYSGYKLPWRGGEDWRTEAINPNYNTWWGWHKDSFGASLDFNPPANSSLDILASASGQVVWKCSDKYGQSALHVRTIVNGRNYGDTLRYYHLDSSKVAVSANQSVVQGQVLAKLSGLKNNQSDPGCRLPSDTVHLHFGFPYTPITFDGYQFVENGQLYQNTPLISSQPAKAKILEPKNNQSVELGLRYQIVNNTEGLYDNSVAQIALFENSGLTRNTVTKVELYENDQKILEATERFSEIFWYPKNTGERRLKMRVWYVSGLSEFTDEIKVFSSLRTSAWKSDRSVAINYPVVTEVLSSGFASQKYLDNAGNLRQRQSETTDIINEPGRWSAWETTPGSMESVSVKTTTGYFETKKSSTGKVSGRMSMDNGQTWSAWIENTFVAKFEPDLVEKDGKIIQTVVGTDGYIYWREIHLHHVGQVELA